MKTKKKNIFMPKNHMDALYNSANPLVKFVHNQRLDQIVKMMPNQNNKILDAGCGEGHLIQKLYSKNRKNSYYGIDITKIALQEAKKRCPYAKLYKMDLSKINFKNEFFDIIICTEVLEHIYEYKDVIKELKRILKKGGYLVVSFPNEILWTISRFLLRRKPIKVPDHVNQFAPNNIKSLIKLQLISKIGLPFKLPFWGSLNYLMKFKK